MTTEYTQNFRLNLPDFREGPWHDLVNQDFITIDDLMMSVIQGVDTQPWKNNTSFTAGMTAIDLTDNTYWVCCVSHTSSPLPTTFAQDRAAHPTYWSRVVVGISPRGLWANSTHYLPNDLVSDPTSGVIALCVLDHTSSPAPATIRTDAAKWAFIADMGVGGKASGITYDNTVSGVAATNVQTALDINFVNDEINDERIDGNIEDIDALEVRVTGTETVNDTQNTNITTNTDDITLLKARVTNVEDDYVPEAPVDGNTYGRRNTVWTEVGGAATDAVIYNPQTLTAPQQAQARTNISAALNTDLALRVAKAGDTMTGHLTLPASPGIYHAVRRDYVDSAIAGVGGGGVDEVLEYNNLVAFPATGVAGLIYVAKDTNKIYRWADISYATFDGTPAAGVALSNGNLTVTHGTTNNGTGVKSLHTQNTGKYFFEIKLTVSTTNANGGGIVPSPGGAFSDAVNFASGFGCSYGSGSSLIYTDGVNTTKNLGAAVVNDVFGYAIDLTARLGWVRRNSGLWNNDATADPATGIGGVAIPAGALAPFVRFTNGAATDVLTGNFGASAFSGAVPSGFTAGWFFAKYLELGLDNDKVLKAGDTMTGPLVMPGNGIASANSINFGAPATGIIGNASGVFVCTGGAIRLSIGNLQFQTTAPLSVPAGAANGTSISFGNNTAGIYGTASSVSMAAAGVNKSTLTATELTMTVPIVLPGNPTTALQAATKQYVDLPLTSLSDRIRSLEDRIRELERLL